MFALLWCHHHQIDGTAQKCSIFYIIISKPTLFWLKFVVINSWNKKLFVYLEQNLSFRLP